MTDERNLYREAEKLKPVKDTILDVWETYAGAMQDASREIKFRRYWMDRMEADRKSAEESLRRSLSRESELVSLIQDVRHTLWSTTDHEDLQELMDRIEGVMNAPVDPRDLERNYRKEDSA